MKATVDEVLASMLGADVLRFAISLVEHGPTADHGAHISGRFRLDVLEYLRRHPHFKGGPALLHGEVGTPRMEFRSFRGAFQEGSSLQIVVNLRDGRFYADHD